jgi:hypothetical protein
MFPRPLRFAVAAAALCALCTLGSLCGPNQSVGWICLNPVTHKEDPSYGDPNHYVGGVFDPCHCYDPCGPAESCPIVVDAGPPPAGCDAGANDADPGTGGTSGGTSGGDGG